MLHPSRSARPGLALLAMLGVALSACTDQPTAAGGPGEAPRPRLATQIDHTQLVPWAPPQDDAGVYLLPKACDVLIGQEIIPPPDMPMRFTHQLLVQVPTGARVKLVNRADYPADFFPAYPHADVTDDPIEVRDGHRVFRCSAADPANPSRPVVEPVTDHAGKGDGPAVHTDGVTLDLNGFGLVPDPSATDLDPRYDNIGIVIGASGVTLTNSATLGADGAGVAFISRFGHNIDIEADNATVQGARWRAADTDPWVYGIETTGGVGARLSSGTIRVDQIKSVDLDPILGQGFEIRRCLAGSLAIISNSHFEGGLEGAFIRECAGVTLENNFLSSPNGVGIATREATGTLDRPNRLLGNLVRNLSLVNAENGIVLDDRAAHFQISGNTVEGFHCGIQVFSANAGIPSRAALEADNTLNTTPQTCDGTFIAPANEPPVVDFSANCRELECTFTDATIDPDGALLTATYAWSFGDGRSAATPGPHTITYAAGGSYQVTLRVIDELGAAGELTRQVSVSLAANQRPSALFSVVQCAQDGTFTCIFQDDSGDLDGDPLTHAWAFGDGTTATGVDGIGQQVHAYRGIGFYNVTLAVDDGRGGTDTASVPATVVGPITATLAGVSLRNGQRRVDLRWRGALGTQVELLRQLGTNPVVRRTINNTGRVLDPVTVRGTYFYRVCNLVTGSGATQRVCSARVRVQV